MKHRCRARGCTSPGTDLAPTAATGRGRAQVSPPRGCRCRRRSLPGTPRTGRSTAGRPASGVRWRPTPLRGPRTSGWEGTKGMGQRRWSASRPVDIHCRRGGVRRSVTAARRERPPCRPPGVRPRGRGSGRCGSAKGPPAQPAAGRRSASMARPRAGDGGDAFGGERGARGAVRGVRQEVGGAVVGDGGHDHPGEGREHLVQSHDAGRGGGGARQEFLPAGLLPLPLDVRAGADPLDDRVPVAYRSGVDGEVPVPPWSAAAGRCGSSGAPVRPGPAATTRRWRRGRRGGGRRSIRRRGTPPSSARSPAASRGSARSRRPWGRSPTPSGIRRRPDCGSAPARGGVPRTGRGCAPRRSPVR